jgi:hypothetical protein
MQRDEMAEGPGHMDDRTSNRGRGWSWGSVLLILAALGVIGIGVAYKYTGDFTSLMAFGTSGRNQPQ